MAKKIKTNIGNKEEFGEWFASYIDRTFEGSRMAAAKHFKEERTIIGDVIAARRSPTKRILEALKGGKRTEHYFYVGVK